VEPSPESIDSGRACAIDDVVSESPTADSRAGNPWSTEEDRALVDGLRSGATVAVLAEKCGRTEGAVEARLARMIPSTEKVGRAEAADWLRERFRVEDYPWQEVLDRRTTSSRNARKAPKTRLSREAAATPPPGRVDVADQKSADVLAVWQDTVDFELPEPRAAAFVARPEVDELQRYPDEVLTAAARSEFHRHGELRLDRWLTECARTALAVPTVGWSQVAEAHAVREVVRRIVDSAVAALPSASRRAVLTYRLGLADSPPETLRAIGDRLDLSQTRVGELQKRALTGLRRPISGAPARRLLSDLCAAAEAAGTTRAESLRILAHLGLPGADVRVAVAVLAVLTGSAQDDAVLGADATDSNASVVRRGQ
jgi:hypothetical protein